MNNKSGKKDKSKRMDRSFSLSVSDDSSTNGGLK